MVFGCVQNQGSITQKAAWVGCKYIAVITAKWSLGPCESWNSGNPHTCNMSRGNVGNSESRRLTPRQNVPYALSRMAPEFLSAGEAKVLEVGVSLGIIFRAVNAYILLFTQAMVVSLLSCESQCALLMGSWNRSSRSKRGALDVVMQYYYYNGLHASRKYNTGENLR